MVSDTFLPRINLTLTEHEFWLGRQYKVHTKREISIATFTFYHLQTVFWLTADLAPGPSNSLFQILMPIPWQPGQDEQKENNPDNTMFHMESSAHTTSLASSLLLDATQVDHTCTIAQMHIKKVFSIFISDSPFFSSSRQIFSLWQTLRPCMPTRLSCSPSSPPSPPPSPVSPATHMSLSSSSFQGSKQSNSSRPLNTPTGRIKPATLKTFLALF